MLPRCLLPPLLVLCAFALRSPAALNVTVTDQGGSVILNNGIVSVEISKTSGNILSLHYQGFSVLSRPAYLDWHTGVNNHIRDGQFSLRTDPRSNGGEMAEVSIAQKYSGHGAAFDVELHHILRRGDSGFYSFAVFRHPQSYPPARMAQSRMVFRVRDDLFNFINVDDHRREFMPPSDTPFQELGPKESLRMTAGPWKGFITDKYHFFTDAGEHFVHGWSGTNQNLGCWVLYGSTEDQNGGPTKQHNTAHFPRILLKILTCSHYGAAGVRVGTNSWEKIYGPWMIYLNSGGNLDQLWTDAKRKVAAERAAWPYAWMRNPAYPLATKRGAVTGRLRLSDPQDPTLSASNAWVGLAAPKPDWQQQSDGYQFWVRASADGSFTIPKVRAGNYTLYAFVDGVIDQFRRDDVAVGEGRTVNLGVLDWKALRHGRQLWQIGTPDRTAKEFRHGDDYRRWGLWRKYPKEFPHDVNFVVGRSHERTDWNYAQCTVDKNGQWVGTTWNIQFKVSDPIRPGSATLRIAFASAKNADLRVLLNGREIGDSGRFGDDNAVARAGIHGQYSVWDVPFASSLLKPGDNIISLQQRRGGSPWINVMYDCLRLELPF